MNLDLQQHVYEMLRLLGEDPDREGLLDTPKRVAKMYGEIFGGLNENPDEVLAKTFPAEGKTDLIIVQDIPFYSMCEHHLVPFFGKVHIGYIPKERIVGLSKFARLVDVFARRPQVQERITTEIVAAIDRNIDALGVICVVEAEHMCMTMRGIKKPGSLTRTIAKSGVFEGAEVSGYEDRFFRVLK